MNVVDAVRGIYRKLRRPDQFALPYQDVVDTVAEIVAEARLDLVLSPHNHLAKTSDWFTPTENDFPLTDVGVQDVLLPTRIEVRGLDSDQETGIGVPLVDYDVLETSIVGGASFYGDPLRLAFRDSSDTVNQQEYRLVYEEDFMTELGLTSVIGLPNFFKSMIINRGVYQLGPLVQDDSPEYQAFLKATAGVWETLVAANRMQWQKYVRMFKGRATVPKRTFWDNRINPLRTKYFKG